MTGLAQFSVLAALIIGGFGLLAFMFTRLESRLDYRIDRLDYRIDRLEKRIHRREVEMRDGFTSLRRYLAEEFRTQRAEVAQQVTAITNAIIASRK